MKEINQWLLSVTGISISLNNVEMILGLEEELNSVLNYMDIVLLKYKQYIYHCRYLKMKPVCKMFTKQHLYIKNTEKYIVVKKK